MITAKKWNTSDKVPGTCCKVTGTFPDHSDPIDGSCLTLPTTDNSYYHKVGKDKDISAFFVGHIYNIDVGYILLGLYIEYVERQPTTGM